MPQSQLYLTIEPLHVASKLLGFLVFTVDDETFTPRFAIADFFFLTWGVILNVYMNFLYWTTIFDFVFERSTIMNVSIPYITLSQNVIMLVIIAAGIFRTEKICEIPRKIAEVDGELERTFGVRFDHRRQRGKVRKVIASVFALVIVVIVIRYSSNLIYMSRSSLKTNVYYLWCFCGSTVLLLSFKFAALAVKMRFERVNECLRCTSHHLTTKHLKCLARLHLKIADVIQLINGTFSLSLMLYFVIFFCWFCMYCFLVVSTSREVWLSHSGYILLRLTTNLFIDGLMFNAIRTASLAEMEGMRTARVLLEMRIDCEEAHERQISSFIEQVKFTSMKFSCGLFSYDWKFLFKFLSAVVMYVIFMVQFESTIRGRAPAAAAAVDMCPRNLTID